MSAQQTETIDGAATGRDTLSRDLSAKGAMFQPGVSNAMLGLANAESLTMIDQVSAGRGTRTPKLMEEGGNEIIVDPSKAALQEVKDTLGNYTTEDRVDDIVNTYEEVNVVLADLDTLHTAIIQKHEADFIISYKDHMSKIQAELVNFKKKTSDHYLKMKKDEKISLLEVSL